MGLRKRDNTRLAEWSMQISAAGADAGIFATCLWDKHTKQRHLDLRYVSRSGKNTRLGLKFAQGEQVRNLHAALERFLAHVARCDPQQPCVED